MVQTLLTDRMEAMTQLADLKRRILQNAQESDFTFAQHALQQDYLMQVYLLSLQKHWQGELFAYSGESGDMLAQGQRLVSIFNSPKTSSASPVMWFISKMTM